MNEKTEKDGTGKLQNSADIAKTADSTAATCAQTSADAAADRVQNHPCSGRPPPRCSDRPVRSALHDLPISEYIGDHLSFFRCRNLVLFLLLYRKVQGSIRQRQSAKEAYQGASVWGGRIFARYLRVFNS